MRRPYATYRQLALISTQMVAVDDMAGLRSYLSAPRAMCSFIRPLARRFIWFRCVSS